jgi:hypothetical protein
MNPKELQQRIVKSLGGKAVAAEFRISQSLVFAWCGNSPENRNISPMEKISRMMRLLVSSGDLATAEDIVAYLARDIPDIHIIKIIKGGK